MNILRVFLIFGLVFSNQVTWAQQTETTKTHELFKSLDYPELQVVPLASRRLKLEASDEKKNWWYAHWTIQASAASALITPFLLDGQKKTDLSAEDENDFNTGKTGALLVSVGWLGALAIMGAMKPYQDAYKDVRSIKKNDKRSKLLRERIAEEALQKQASLYKKLKWAAAISNTVVIANLAGSVEGTGTTYAAAGIIAALLPLFFEDRSVFTYKKHMEYKKNIYAPVTSVTPKQNKTLAGSEVYPSLDFTWVF